MKLYAVSLLLCLTTTNFALAKNVILLIGDGLGQAQITVARLELALKSKGKGKLTIDSLPQVAIVKTYSADRIVTDSAAAATAIACGVKTINMYLGVDKNKKVVNSIAHYAKRKGKAVGLVTNTFVTHATPAGFYAHTASRFDNKKILQDLLKAKYDLVFGGGRDAFSGKLKEIEKSFTILKTKKDLKIKLMSAKKPVLGLFANRHMADATKNDTSEPSLSGMTREAIKKLAKEKKGFFLMVEAGKIDFAAHDNNIARETAEFMEFDKTIKVAIDTVKSTKGISLKDTMIIATSDHETGGVVINGYPYLDQSPVTGKISKDKRFSKTGYEKVPFSYKIVSYANGPGTDTPLRKSTHTGVDVPAYSIGYKNGLIRGTMDNTDFYKIMVEGLK